MIHFVLTLDYVHSAATRPGDRQDRGTIRPDPESPHHDPPLQRGRAQDPDQLQGQRQQVI